MESRGVAGRLKCLISKPRVSVRPAWAFGGRYLLASAESRGRSGIDWREVSRALGPGVRCLLTPREYPPPPGLGWERGFPEFERLFLSDTACRLIEGSGIPLYRRVLGLYDPEGVMAERLSEMLKYFCSARVVTRAMSLYEEAALRALEELGAPVMLSDEPSDFSDCALLLCPSPVTEPMPLLPGCPVMASGAFADEKGCNVLSEPKASIPAHLAALPEGVDDHAFAGAMWRYWGLWPSWLGAGRMLLNGRSVCLSEARALLAREAGYSG